MTLLTISDLNTTINHEPRIMDLRIGELLGFSRPRDIRALITDNIQELETYGGVCGDKPQTSSKGGRPSISYWLNEAQALLLCMFSKTEKAAEVRKAVIDTFMAWRKGQLMPTQITAEQRNAIQQTVAERAGDDGKKRMYFWSRFNNHFKIPSYKDLPAVMFDVAIQYIKEMPEKEQKALPVPEKPFDSIRAMYELNHVKKRLQGLIGITELAPIGNNGKLSWVVDDMLNWANAHLSYLEDIIDTKKKLN